MLYFVQGLAQSTILEFQPEVVNFFVVAMTSLPPVSKMAAVKIQFLVCLCEVIMPFFFCFQGSRLGIELDPEWMLEKSAGLDPESLFQQFCSCLK